jgi:transcriptional regulator with XRE-family HTH domain
MMGTLVAEKPFGRWLEERIYPRGWSLVQFSRLAGVSHPAISSWINDGVRPQRKACYAIARVLEVDPNEVLEAAGHQPDAREPEPPAVQYFDAETMTDDEAAAIGRMIVQELARMRARRAKPQ